MRATRTLASPNLRFVVGRCEAIPLASQSIDVVVCFETIEHLEQQAELLDEIKRVLTPDGVLVISSPDRLVVLREHDRRCQPVPREGAVSSRARGVAPRAVPDGAALGPAARRGHLLLQPQRAGRPIGQRLGAGR